MSLSSHFEERLLQDLREIVAERPAAVPAPDSTVAPTRHQVRRRFVLAGAGGVAAALAAVALFAGSGGTEPAYAVAPRADGSVTVKISSLRDADGLQRALRDAGVPAVVRYDTGKACPTPAGDAGREGGTVERHEDSGPTLESAGTEPAPGAAQAPKVTAGVATGAAGTTFTIDADAMGAGEKVYITASEGRLQSLALAIAKDAPGCVPTPGR